MVTISLPLTDTTCNVIITKIPTEKVLFHSPKITLLFICFVMFPDRAWEYLPTHNIYVNILCVSCNLWNLSSSRIVADKIGGWLEAVQAISMPKICISYLFVFLGLGCFLRI